MISAKCKTCQHPEINKINEMLISGVSSYKVAEQFNLMDRGVRLHREKHLPKTLVRAKKLQEQSAADELLERVEKIHNKAWSIMQEAERNRKYSSAVGALREARQCLELTGRLLGELKSGHTINIHYNPQWVQLRGTIFAVLEEYPEARAKLVNKLSEIEEAESEVIEGAVIDATD
jgi:hypothetical protein